LQVLPVVLVLSPVIQLEIGIIGFIIAFPRLSSYSRLDLFQVLHL